MIMMVTVVIMAMIIMPVSVEDYSSHLDVF